MVLEAVWKTLVKKVMQIYCLCVVLMLGIVFTDIQTFQIKKLNLIFQKSHLNFLVVSVFYLIDASNVSLFKARVIGLVLFTNFN